LGVPRELNALNIKVHDGNTKEAKETQLRKAQEELTRRTREGTVDRHEPGVRNPFPGQMLVFVRGPS
jgi:hypothetical protein